MKTHRLLVLVGTVPALAALACISPKEGQRSPVEQAAPGTVATGPMTLDEFGLPLPQKPLKVSGGLGVTTLGNFVRELSAITGQSLLYQGETRTALEDVEFSFKESFEVPQDEAYQYVESALYHHRFLIAPRNDGERPWLSVYWLGSVNTLQSSSWTEVHPEDGPKLARHPALIVQTVVELPDVDLRLLVSQLHSFVSDPRYQMMLPLSTHSLLMRGTGVEVAQWLEVLDEAEQAMKLEAWTAPATPEGVPPLESAPVPDPATAPVGGG